MERLYVLAPALIAAALLLAAFVVYSALCAAGRVPEISGFDRRRFSHLLGPFLIRFMLWVIRPAERLFVVGRVSPNAVTLVSLGLCVGAGVAIGTDHLATGAWLYVLAGVLDILDGRLARATNQQSAAGALFDSVADRWGELAVLAGCAWYLKDGGWLLAVMLAIAGSMMVSYTRARGEGLGIELDGGMMQRAERILIVVLGAAIAAWFAATPEDAAYAAPALGGALLVCGALASATAIGRWSEGFRRLLERERAAAARPPAVIRVAEGRARGGRVSGGGPA